MKLELNERPKVATRNGLNIIGIKTPSYAWIKNINTLIFGALNFFASKKQNHKETPKREFCRTP